MRFKCIITFKTSRSRAVSSWRAKGHGEDHLSFAAEKISQLRKRQRRQVTIVGVMVHNPEAAAA
jgi:hypothetical protein